MSKEKKEKAETKGRINVNGKDYLIDNLSDEQKAMVNHIMDIKKKISSNQFILQQLQVCESSFTGMLTKSVEGVQEEVECDLDSK